MRTLLIVDADTGSSSAANAFLSERYAIRVVPSLKAGLDLLGRQEFELVLLDLSAGTIGDASDPVRAMASRAGGAAIVCCSLRADPELIMDAAKCGASAFAPKPFVPDGIKRALRIAIAERRGGSPSGCVRAPSADYRASQPDLDDQDDEEEGPYTGPILGDSPAIWKVRSKIRLFAQHDSPVLILGESGTGKELTATEVHARSSRRQRPFVPVDCASIPEALAESELFGTVRGAFTGAVERRGVFEEANGGTVFLDEVGELSLPVQAKLLRALESRSGVRVGSVRAASFDIRLISATNSPVFNDSRRFRPELLNRLNTLVIRMPSLRNHAEDIPVLARAFLAQFDPGKSITDEAMEKLQAWHWPGNGRELKNTVHRAAVLSGKRPQIRASHVETQADAAWGDIQKQLL